MSRLLPHLAEARARLTLRASGLPHDGALEAASSTHNEIHLSARHVIRVSTQLNRRLRREGLLYAFLPRASWSPSLVASGERSGTDYVIVDRKPGQPLAHCWPFLSAAQRREAVAGLAVVMRAIHAVPTPPPDALPPLEETLHLIDEVPGAGSLRRVQPMLEGLDRLAADPHVDRGVVAMAQEYVMANAHHLDDFDRSHLVHGDLTFENVLHDGRGISAVIDFEWCRGGPPDIDLDVLLRCCAIPHAHVANQFQERTRPEDYAAVTGWLSEDYPELFSHPHLVERLTLYALGFDLRDALEQPLPVQRADVDDLHPYNRLVSLVSTGGHVALLLERAGLAV